MARVKGTANFSVNFEPTGQSCLDARLVVNSYADLLDKATYGTKNLYTGMVVAVLAGNADATKPELYMFVGDPTVNGDANDTTNERLDPTKWVRLNADEQQITDAIAAIQGDDITVTRTGDIFSSLLKIKEVTPADTNYKEYQLVGSDNNNVNSGVNIVVPYDQHLKNVRVVKLADTPHTYLAKSGDTITTTALTEDCIVYTIVDEKNRDYEIALPLSSLINANQAGDGITADNGKYKLTIASDSEQLGGTDVLSLSGTGNKELKISGINTAITNAIDALDSTTANATDADVNMVVEVTQTNGIVTTKSITRNAENIAATPISNDPTKINVAGDNVKEQIDSIATTLKTTENNTKRYKVEAVNATELATLNNENIKEAYRLVSYTGSMISPQNVTKEGEYIKIYKDSSLESVALGTLPTIAASDLEGTMPTQDAETLYFTYVLASGKKSVVGVNLGNFLQQSEYGAGLEAFADDQDSTDLNKVRVKIDSTSTKIGSSNIISVSNNGVKVDLSPITKSNTVSATTYAQSLTNLSQTNSQIAYEVEDVVANKVKTTAIAASTTTGSESIAVAGTNVDDQIKDIAKSIAVKNTSLDSDIDGLDTRIGTIEADKTYVKSAKINGVESSTANNGVVDITNNKLTITLAGKDIKVTNYAALTAAPTNVNILPADTINQALAKLEWDISWHEAN